MPAKIPRLATRPLFWIPEVSVAVRSSRPSCSKAEKREYSWQIGSHPGNPGLNQLSAKSVEAPDQFGRDELRRLLGEFRATVTTNRNAPGHPFSPRATKYGETFAGHCVEFSFEP